MLKGIYSRGNIYIYDVSFNNNITIKCGIYIYFRVRVVNVCMCRIILKFVFKEVRI